MFKRRKREEDAEVETNLIPVLSCLFLLIPALLLAMEIAPFTSVRVEPPKFCDGHRADPHTPQPEPLRLRVHVRTDGFTTRYGSTMDSERKIDIPLSGNGKHDFEALEAKASELKEHFPDDTVVTITAENSVEYRTLVQSMDALRGRECSLKSAIYGEYPPEGCYFWSVVVQSGTV